MFQKELKHLFDKIVDELVFARFQIAHLLNGYFGRNISDNLLVKTAQAKVALVEYLCKPRNEPVSQHDGVHLSKSQEIAGDQDVKYIGEVDAF